MDEYQERMQKMMSIPEEQRKKMMAELRSMCICASCPSYEGTGETELMFCTLGKSSKITEEKGCTCPGCLVTEKIGLTKLYFCIKGSERQQREMTR